VAFDVAVWMACAIALVLWPLRLARKLLRRRVFSLWSGTPIITMATNCRAERLLGVDAKSLVFTTYFITDAFDYNLSRAASLPLIGRFLPVAVFLWACVVADRLHFYCDRGILPSRRPFTFDFRELRVYRLLGLDVFLWAYGADVRNREASQGQGRPNSCSDCDAPGKYCLCDPALAAENMRKLSVLSRAIFSGMGDMFGYTPGSVDDVYYWPLELDSEGGDKYRPFYPQHASEKPLRIVHASNHRMFKGTRYLIQAVEALRAEGEPVELVLVERVPNSRALELYRSADVIFDNCLMGNYGFFGLEGMALGKPVMCFVRHPETYVLHPEECPILPCHVTTLKEDIHAVLRRRDELAEIGRRSRRYVEKHFTPQAFARRLGTAYARLGVRTQ
jgi:glycosyltransferase involved in cell wall biosynthesis